MYQLLSVGHTLVSTANVTDIKTVLGPGIWDYNLVNEIPSLCPYTPKPQPLLNFFLYRIPPRGILQNFEFYNPKLGSCQIIPSIYFDSHPF